MPDWNPEHFSAERTGIKRIWSPVGSGAATARLARLYPQLRDKSIDLPPAGVGARGRHGQIRKAVHRKRKNIDVVELLDQSETLWKRLVLLIEHRLSVVASSISL